MDFNDQLFILPPSSGGGPTDFTILTLKDYKAKPVDAFEKAIILVTDTAADSGEKNSITKVALDPKTVLAVNGPAFEKILSELPNTHALVKLVYRNDSNIKNINEIVPQQVVFLAMFHQMFFVGIANDKIKVDFSDTFKNKFNAVRGKLEDEEYVGVPDYYEVLQNKYITDKSKYEKYEDFIALVVGGIRGVAKFIQNGVMDDTATAHGYNNIDATNEEEEEKGEEEDNNENYGDDVQELKRQLEEVQAELRNAKTKSETAIKEANAKAESSATALAKAQTELTNAKAEATAAETEKERLLGQLRALPKGRADKVQDLVAEEDKRKLEEEVAKLKAKVTAAADYDTIKEDLRKKTTEVEELKKERNELQTKYDKEKEEADRLRVILASRGVVDILGKNKDGAEIKLGNIVEQKEGKYKGKRGIALRKRGNSLQSVQLKPESDIELADDDIIMSTRSKLLKRINSPAATRKNRIIAGRKALSRYNKSLKGPRPPAAPKEPKPAGQSAPLGNYKDGSPIFKDDLVTIEEPGKPKKDGKVKFLNKDNRLGVSLARLSEDGTVTYGAVQYFEIENVTKKV